MARRTSVYDAGDGSRYSAVHARHHPWFHQIQQTREYYDIFLFNAEGDLIYTVFKELDYATNFSSGEWAETDLGQVFRDAVAQPREGFQTFQDFEPYAPSNDAPASFIATPVLDADGQLLGVVAFQMPIGRINRLMGNRAGMGETGEAYLVGPDFLMRSDSRFSEKSTILVRKVEGPTVRAALKGGAGIEIIDDYRGVPVISAYKPFDFMA
ncbi:MAG: cache domain-containing protein [Sphingomonadales bacterium]